MVLLGRLYRQNDRRQQAISAAAFQTIIAKVGRIEYNTGLYGMQEHDMSLIVGEGISKSWSEKDVLKNVSFTLAPGERVGLVGPNGQGKTTLIRIIAGLEPETTGTFQRKSDLRIGYLPQDPPALEGATLRSAMVDVFGRLHRIEQELHDLAGKMGEEGPSPEEHEKVLARYGQ